MRFNQPSLAVSAIGALLLGGLLSACSTFVKQASEQEITKAVEQELPEIEQAWTMPVAFEKQGAAQIDWLESFNDPQLVRLVDEALLNNKNLQAAAAGIGQAQGLAASADAALKPKVGLTVEEQRAGSVSSDRPAQSTQSVGLQVSWELDIWGRAKLGKRAADASAAAVLADFQFAKHSLAASTVKAYLTVVESKLQSGITRELLDAMSESHRIVKVRFDNDLSSSEDLALANADLASAKERLLLVEGAQRDATRGLEILLGRYPASELKSRATLPDLPSLPPVGVPSSVLERRPDIIAAERRVAAAFNQLAQAKTARLPSLSLTGAVGGSSSSLSNVLNPTNAAWQLGANLMAPLYDGGAGKAQVQVASAKQKQALAAYAQTALTAFSEVESALDHGLVLSQRAQQLKIVVAENQKAWQIYQQRYKEGEIGLLDVLTIQQRLIGAKSDLISVHRKLLEQRVNLHLALGGDWAQRSGGGQ